MLEVTANFEVALHRSTASLSPVPSYRFAATFMFSDFFCSNIFTGLGASWFRVLGHGYSCSQAVVSWYCRHSVSEIRGIFTKSSRALRRKIKRRNRN